MLFNSYIFIFLFLPLSLAGFYYLESKRATLAKVWLTCFSLWFYGYFNTKYLLIMIISILGNYGFHLAILKESKTGKQREKLIFILGIFLNLAALFYFKYYDFFISNLNGILGTDFMVRGILLPLGISFFTFQQISFLTDTYRGELPRCKLVDYALFVSFFPQLIAGPIVIHEEMLPQLERIGKDTRSKEERQYLFLQGIYVFVLGLSKKVLLADIFGLAVDYGYGNLASLNGLESFLVVIFYSLQLYFDFSGYCDMAKGLGSMFGMEIANNFDSPYKAVNIIDFWKRWHITLSRFFTKNIYIPLGGNRKGAIITCRNLFLVFFLSGIWHGAGWNYLLW
ncbi:MAG: MBOAT family protein, partial [Lachnospiraceae bacterium]|nr:MBOAT family protein [Lachnospiraceae bacterium]